MSDPAPTVEQYKQQVIREVGDNDAGLLQGQIELIWTLAGAKSQVPAIRFYHAKLTAIDMMLGDVRRDVDYADLALKESLTDLLNNLLKMKESTKADLAAAVATQGQTSGARRGGAAGVIARQAPSSPPWPGSIDANDPAYRGDAYRRSRGGS